MCQLRRRSRATVTVVEYYSAMRTMGTTDSYAEGEPWKHTERRTLVTKGRMGARDGAAVKSTSYRNPSSVLSTHVR